MWSKILSEAFIFHVLIAWNTLGSKENQISYVSLPHYLFLYILSFYLFNSKLHEPITLNNKNTRPQQQ